MTVKSHGSSCFSMFCLANTTSGPPLRFFRHTGLQTQGVNALTSVLRTELKPRNSNSPEACDGARQRTGDSPAGLAGWHCGDSPIPIPETNKWSKGCVAKFRNTELFAKLKRRGHRSKQGDLGTPPLPPCLPGRTSTSRFDRAIRTGNDRCPASACDLPSLLS